MTPEQKMQAIAQWAKANASSAPAMNQPQSAPLSMGPPQVMPPSMGAPVSTGTPLSFDAMDQMRASQMQMYPPSQPQQPMPLSAEQVQAALRSQSDDDIMKASQPKPKFQQLKSKISGPIEVADEEEPVKVGFQDEE
jgi:hypothetical protein